MNELKYLIKTFKAKVKYVRKHFKVLVALIVCQASTLFMNAWFNFLFSH